MELLHYWRIVRKRWWIVLLVVILVVGAAATYTLQRPTEYQSTSTLLLNPAVPSSLVPYVQAQVASNLSDSYTELMRTDSFAASVAKELKNTMSPESIAAAIQTRLVPNTLFFKITAQSGDPQTAREVADAVVKVFLSANQSPAQAQVDGGLTQNQKDMRDRLTNKLNYLADEIKSYQDQITALEKQAASKDRDDQLLQLRGQLVSLEQSETDTMVAVAGITKDDSGRNSALVVDPAQPGLPVPSPLARNLLLAFVASLALGIGLAFFLDYLDYTVRSPEYLEQVLGLTPMAVIGIVRGQVGMAYGRARRKQAQGSRGSKTPASPNAEGKTEGVGNLETKEYPKSP
jgi:capsular polysaccharide biosynthesis protein